MNVSNEFVPNSSDGMNAPPQIARTAAELTSTHQLASAISRRGFWIAIGALILLAALGLGGQFIGLRSIDAYARVRGQLISAQNEHARLTAETTVLGKELANVRAEAENARLQLERQNQQLAEVKRTEQLALEATTNAQEIYAKAVAEKVAAVQEREVAIEARDSARKDTERLNSGITNLRSEKDTLEAAVIALRTTRENLDTTLAELKQETAALQDTSQLVTSKRTEARDLETLLRDLHAKAEAIRAREQVASQVSLEISALEEQRAQLVAATEKLQQQEVAGRERAKAAESELEIILGTLAAANARAINLEQSEKQLAAQVQSATLQAKSVEEHLRMKQAELDVRKAELSEIQKQIDDKKGDLETILGRVGSQTEFLKQLDQSRSDVVTAQQEVKVLQESLIASRNTLADVDAQVESRRRELASLSARVDDLRSDESRRLATLRDLLGTLEAALRAVTAVESKPEQAETVEPNSNP